MEKDPAGRDPEPAAAAAAELRGLIGKLMRRMREQVPPGDLTWAQFVVLGQIAREGPSTVSALARAENMRPQSMGAIVAALQEAGLVRGEADPRDARQAIIALTEAGQDRVKDARAAREDWLFQTIGSRYSPEEQRDLARGVALLRRLLDR